MAPAAFAPTAVCMECASFVARIVALPTKHDIDNGIYHFSRNTRHDSRTDCRRTAFVFDRTSDRRSLANSDTAETDKSKTENYY